MLEISKTLRKKKIPTSRPMQRRWVCLSGVALLVPLVILLHISSVEFTPGNIAAFHETRNVSATSPAATARPSQEAFYYPKHRVFDPVFNAFLVERWETFMLVSAFLDARPVLFGKDPRISLIAVVPFKRPDLLVDAQCFLMDSRGEIKSSRTELLPHLEHHRARMYIVLVSCYLEPSVLVESCSSPECLEDFIPIAATFVPNKFVFNQSHFINVSWTSSMTSLLHSKDSGETSFLHRINPRVFSSPQFQERPSPFLDWAPDSFSICTAPLHDSDFDTYLTQFLEYYRDSGASKVLIYDFRPSLKAKAHLKSLDKNQSFVEVVPWKIPQCSTIIRRGCRDAYHYIHYYGQIAAIADCVLRNAGASKWILLVDFDEFLSSQLADERLPQLFSRLFQSLRENKLEMHQLWGIHFFSYFYARHNSSSPVLQNLSIPAHQQEYVSAFISPFKQRRTEGLALRSKFLFSPLNVDSMGIHFPFHSLGSNESIVLRNLSAWIYEWRFQNCLTLTPLFAERLDGKVFYVHPDQAHIHHIRFPNRFKTKNKQYVPPRSFLLSHAREFAERVINSSFLLDSSLNHKSN
jgi:hypothetical protein